MCQGLPGDLNKLEVVLCDDSTVMRGNAGGTRTDFYLCAVPAWHFRVGLSAADDKNTGTGSPVDTQSLVVSYWRPFKVAFHEGNQY